MCNAMQDIYIYKREVSVCLFVRLLPFHAQTTRDRPPDPYIFLISVSLGWFRANKNFENFQYKFWLFFKILLLAALAALLGSMKNGDFQGKKSRMHWLTSGTHCVQRWFIDTPKGSKNYPPPEKIKLEIRMKIEIRIKLKLKSRLKYESN